MADQGGLDVMRNRIERASRRAPTSRRVPTPREVGPLPEPKDKIPGDESPTERSQERRAPSREAGTSPLRRERRATPVRLGATLPPVNLAIRVRKPLDDRLVDVIYQLRSDGVRTSKVELIEMLLWEMPGDQLPALRERLRQFREWAPRGTGGPIEPTAEAS